MVAAPFFVHFNPRPPWGGRQQGRYKSRDKRRISIHALRGEGDRVKQCEIQDWKEFQSTPSVGRATITVRTAAQKWKNFNPRPPWGGRPQSEYLATANKIFQSTPSVGRATLLPCAMVIAVLDISIHALRGEGDQGFRAVWCSGWEHFNPRPPWGGRRRQKLGGSRMTVISIHALRGEGDPSMLCSVCLSDISIHALRGEGDDPRGLSPRTEKAFQSTPSVGRATDIILHGVITKQFQSTPSVGRATVSKLRAVAAASIFQSTPSVGRATTARK